jgi:hypothetical protein
MDGAYPGGGSRQLGQLIDDGHGAAIRYDLQRLGLDLADVWRGSLAPARALELIEQGPDDSALRARLRGGLEHRAWPLERHFQAALIDAVNDVAWVVAQSNSKKRITPPKRVLRPALSMTARNAEPRRPFSLASHPLARPLPEKYRNQTRGG